MSKVTLDRETFKALASETRLQILHALDERRKTGSELARELELNKATVHEHLQTLVAAGLVTKKDEGRKWVYWELSWEGSKLLHPGQGAVFSVLLGLGILTAGGSFLSLGAALGWWFDSMGSTGGESGTTIAFAPEAEESADEADRSPSDDDAAGDADGADAPEGALEAPAEQAIEDEAAASGEGDGFGLGAIMLLLTAVVCLAMAIWLRKRR